jgi:hypothetical protein
MSEGGEPITSGDVDRDAESGNSSESISPEEQEEIDKNVADALENFEKGEGTKALQSLFDANMDVYSKSIEKRVSNPEDAKELINMIKDLQSTITDNIELDSDGKPVYDSLFRRGGPFVDSSGKFKYKPKSSFDTSKARNAMDEYVKSVRSDTLNGVKSIFPEFADSVERNGLTREKGGGPDSPPGAESLDPQPNLERSSTIADEATSGDKGKERTDEYNKRTNERTRNMLNEGDLDPKSYKGRNSSLKYLIQALSLLLTIGGLGAFAWFLIWNAMANSGCHVISCGDGDVFPVMSKSLCYSENRNIFNPTEGTYDFVSSNCNCNKVTSPKNCSKDVCKFNSGKEQDSSLRPFNTDCQPGFQCSDDDHSKCPTLYYSYQIMDPISALGNVLAGAANAGNKEGSYWINLIIHAAIVIGIIMGVLLVIWIIYKVVENRKPTETLKIETPSTVTKFGNRGYLGNLSKYNNYAYMGRCPYSSNLPYKFLTAKNLINTVS